jgi:hypothetical protein
LSASFQKAESTSSSHGSFPSTDFAEEPKKWTEKLSAKLKGKGDQENEAKEAVRGRIQA